MLTIQENVSNFHRAYGFGYLNSPIGVAFGGMPKHLLGQGLHGVKNTGLGTLQSYDFVIMLQRFIVLKVWSC